MKSSITPTSSAFQPITLTITIESPQELASLWHRMNENHGKAAMCPMSALWKLLNDAASKRGISIEGVL